MVGSEQVYCSPVSRNGGSKPEVVNRNSENLHALYISCSTLARNEILTATPNIHVRTLHWCYSNDIKLRVNKRKSEIQDGGFENLVAQISADTHDRNEIPTATRDQATLGIDYWEYGSMYDMLEIKDGGH